MSFFRSGGLWALRFQLDASVGGLPMAAVGSEDALDPAAEPPRLANDIAAFKTSAGL